MNKELFENGQAFIKKILVVDDDVSLRTLLVKSLEFKGFQGFEAQNAEEAFRLIFSESPDLVMSDIAMPGMDGISLMKKVKESMPDLDFIIMTGYAVEYSYVDIMDAGASDYMTKPFSINSAVARISRIEREKKTLDRLKKSNHELSRAIKKAKNLAKEADDASKAKTEFLARMSHEIRTPLNGIIGYTDILFDTELTSEQKEYVKNTKLSGEVLLAVVNDILDFSKVEAGHIQLKDMEFDPEVLCFETLELVRTKVNHGSIEMTCSITDSVPAIVKADPHRLRQVLLNLLGNAAKFTDKGEIKLSLDAEAGPDGSAVLHVSVKDTGIGISRDNLKAIFEPFQQSGGTTTRKFEGTGLGLAICRTIAEKMQGKIWAESRLGKGSTFHMTARVEEVDAVVKKRIPPVSLSGKGVFLFTVSAPAQKLLTHELTLAGMDVDSFSDSDQLIRSLANNPDRTYDMGIVDTGIFGRHQGMDIPHRVRELTGIDPKFPMIACSSPEPGEAGRCKQAGFNGFLPKPVRRQKLFAMMKGVLGLSSDTDENDATGAPAAILTTHFLAEECKRSASILLVEDNPVNQKMAAIMLKKGGYSVDTADNGLQVLEMFQKTPMKYDLIFMDISMPEMDGLEATRQIREMEAGMEAAGRVPIVALTANVLTEFEGKCIEAGMDDFLTKPIKRDLVFKAVRTWVTERV